MRLLLINQYYVPDVAPTGRYLHDLARELVSLGHDVHVLCSRRSYSGAASFAPLENRDGVHVHRVPALALGRSGVFSRLADYASFLLPAAWAGLRVPRPDVVLALTTPPFVGLLAKGLATIRAAAHAHWIMDVYPDVLYAHGLIHRGGLAYRLLAACARRQIAGAHLVSAIGPFMAEHVRTRSATEALVEWVPLWSDPSLVPWTPPTPNELRRLRGWRDADFVLMYSGNMGLGHRFGEFLAAAERLGPSGPCWAFVGGGARRDEIETFVRAHPASRVSLYPYATAEDLRESLSSADVHLASLSSAWQGLIVPSKIQAIFAVERPVIFVGPRDNEVAGWIEESGGGWRVEENDVDGLLAAIEQSRDPGERHSRGTAALAFARERFDRDRNCRRLARLVEASLDVPRAEA